ncbi:MAG: nucleotidyltransferase domain-containing protein [Synechococcales bacterium]|nr:nucleotidyltransferase domain-containing protein [Synechococcales bacterium]
MKLSLRMMEAFLIDQTQQMSDAGMDSVIDRPVAEILQQRFQVDLADVAALCDRFRIVEMGIFGSALRDDFRSDGDDPSDVDLLVTFATGDRLSYEEFLDLRDAAMALFGREVDICQKELIDNPYRRAKILRSTQVIYAAQ